MDSTTNNFSYIKKFIEGMGITYTVEVDRSFIDSRGKRNVCILLTAYYKNNVEYEQYDCYEITNHGLIYYGEGDKIVGVRDGIFAYLGDEKNVNNFFENESRKKVEEFLNKK